MTEQMTLRPEDVSSVGSRISWGAIFAGAVLAFGMYSLFTILGAAVGLSISERVRPTTLKNTAIAWTFITVLASVFAGGAVTSQFTVGENKREAMLYGVIMWALLFGFFAALSAVGMRAGFHALVGETSAGDTAATANWEQLALADGVPAAQIDTWRREARNPQNQEAAHEAVTRLTWYAFIGTWVSMLAAALGALVGAHPAFKVIVVRLPNRVG